MGRTGRLIVIAAAPLALGGCLAKTAIDVATLPVKVASKGVDLATTSQSEADQKRGREIRKREERLAQLDRDYRRQLERCENGNEKACDEARAIYAEIEALVPTIPLEPADS